MWLSGTSNACWKHWVLSWTANAVTPLYRHPAVRQRVNIQRQGAQAKPYQVRQVLELVERYGLELEERE
jgi:hypothetical protein